MHPYRILAQISLILSILNLVLAAPIVVQEIHGARADETVVAEDPEAPSDRPTSSQPSPASPQHSSSSGYHATPDLSQDSMGSDYSWSSESEMALPAQILPSSPQPFLPKPEWSEGLEPEMPPSPPLPASPSSSGSEVDLAMTDTNSPQDRFTPSHHLSPSTDWNSDVTQYTSALGVPLSSHYFSQSDGLVPSHHSMPEGPDGSPPPLSSPPTETPSDNAEFFNKNMMKKVKIVAGVIIVGGAIAGIVGSQIKHHEDS
jgi:hypothetical protein